MGAKIGVIGMGRKTTLVAAMGLLETDQRSISNAIKIIKEGTATRVEIDHNTKVYKVPSNNPKKYTIRMDIHVEEEE